MVIDIGGQDSKVIAVDDTGRVTQFEMNDQKVQDEAQAIEAGGMPCAPACAQKQTEQPVTFQAGATQA